MIDYSYNQYLADQETAESLDFAENYLKTTPYTVAAKVCNGIGPSWFPQKLRNLISKLNPTLAPVAQNHDLGYYYGDGTFSNFSRLNNAFLVNGTKASKAKYKWYDIRRYWVIKQAAKYAAECQTCGWPAYTAAIKDRMAHQAETQSS